MSSIRSVVYDSFRTGSRAADASMSPVFGGWPRLPPGRFHVHAGTALRRALGNPLDLGPGLQVRGQAAVGAQHAHPARRPTPTRDIALPTCRGPPEPSSSAMSP